jgi:hypothetical protein
VCAGQRPPGWVTPLVLLIIFSCLRDETLKQLHELNAACIICAKVDQYDVNHYRDHLDNEYNLNICLKCNHMDGLSSSCAVGQDDSQTVHIRQHISNHHGQDDSQCVDDVYLNINLKSIKFIDQSVIYWIFRLRSLIMLQGTSQAVRATTR